MVAKVKELKSTVWVMSLGFVLPLRWEEKGSKHSQKTFRVSQNVVCLYCSLLQVGGNKIKSIPRLAQTLDKSEKKKRGKKTLYRLVQQPAAFQLGSLNSANFNPGSVEFTAKV